MILFSNPIKNELCSRYTLSVNGKEIPAITTRVSSMPFNRFWPGKQRPLEQTEQAAYVFISTDEERLDFTVSVAADFSEVVVRPLAAEIKPSISRRQVCFSVTKHGYYTVELDGPHHALHLFIDPVHHFELPESKDSLYYFGPGVHHAGELRLKSGDTVYIHRDAVVYGAILAVHAKDIRILGEGVLDGSFYERQTESFLLAYDYSRVPDASWEKQQMANIIDSGLDCFTDVKQYQKGRGTFIYRSDVQFDKLLRAMKPVQTGLSFYACENVEITGIILRNCAGLSMTQAGCKDVHYRHVKLIGNWRYNSDGIDFYNCRSCSVRQCFLRTFDDTVCVKGQIGWDTEDSSDILVEDCVLWNDWGHTLDIGVDTVAPAIKNIVFRNCDLIHNTNAAIDVGNGDRADIRGILFENIRVEFSQYDQACIYQSSDQAKFVCQRGTPTLIKMFLSCGTWSIDGLYGNISDVVFRNIAIVTDESSLKPTLEISGYDKEHSIRGVILDHITCNGKHLNCREQFDVITNEFASFEFV